MTVRIALVALLVLLGSAATGTRAQGAQRVTTFAPRSAIAQEISSNWSGYAALAADPVAAPVSFTDVTATWKQPKGTCTAGRASSAAFWVGLGGYDLDATSLEQLGTAAECNGSTGSPTAFAWWELVPAASVRIPMIIKPGDTITAAVLVNGQTITFSLKDVTRRTRFSKVMTSPQALDTRSAEWIAEAPSQCFGNRCSVIPLTNFGNVTFTNIAAIGNAHPGTLTDPTWASSSIELITNGRGDLLFTTGDVLGPGVGAVPGDVTADGRSFPVSWAQNLTPG